MVFAEYFFVYHGAMWSSPSSSCVQAHEIGGDVSWIPPNETSQASHGLNCVSTARDLLKHGNFFSRSLAILYIWMAPQ